jgi:hypothetical protein
VHVFKRYRANYSLWPEQARPRRGRPLRFAIGSFALGVVCAAAYGVVFGFSGPVAAGQKSVARNVVERGPVYASVAPPVTPAPAQIETENRSRPRTPAAKTRLPIIGSQPVLITGTDGYGGDNSDKLVGEAPAADVAASSGNPSTAKREESEFAREIPLPEARPEQAATTGAAERGAKPGKTPVQEKREEPASAAREVPVQEAKSENTEPAVATEPRANTRKQPAATERRTKSRKTIAQKKRERPAKHAAQKSRHKREEPARRAARRQDASPSITEVALQALQAFTGGQGMIGMQGDGF